MSKLYRISDGQETGWAQRIDEGYRRLRGNLVEGFEPTDEVLPEAVRLAPVEPPNVFGIGLNYQGHIDEGWDEGRERPDKPVVFMKATSSVVGPEDAIRLPAKHNDTIDFEAELAVVVGRRATDVSANQALDYLAGATAAIDVTNRRLQEQDIQWVRAKGFDTFCPLGPCLQTDWDRVGEQITGSLNDELQQQARFDEMLFSVPELIEFLSHQFTLLPGTVVLTGTPAGVGFAQDPPRYLEPGDEYRVHVDGIGNLSLPVVGSEQTV